MGVLDSSYICAVGVKWTGLKKVLLIFSDTLIMIHDVLIGYCQPRGEAPSGDGLERQVLSPAPWFVPLRTNRYKYNYQTYKYEHITPVIVCYNVSPDSRSVNLKNTRGNIQA